MSSRRRIPPEYFLTSLPAASAMPNASSSSAARAFASARLRPSRRPIRVRFSLPVRSSSIEASWPVRLTIAAHLFGFLDDVVPEHPRRAGVGAQQRRQHPDRRRLPGPIGPEDPVDRPAADRQVDAVDGADVAEVLDQTARFYRQGRVHVSYDLCKTANSSARGRAVVVSNLWP